MSLELEMDAINTESLTRELVEIGSEPKAGVTIDAVSIGATVGTVLAEEEMGATANVVLTGAEMGATANVVLTGAEMGVAPET